MSAALINNGLSERYCDVSKVETTKIEQLLRNGNKDICRDTLISFLEDSGFYKTKSLLMRLYVTMDLYILIRSFSKEMNVSNEEFVELYGTIDDIEQKMLDLEGTVDFFTGMLKQCIEWRIRYCCNNGNNTVLRAIEYITANYMNEDLSLKSAASYVNLSPTYFCSLFKKETGMNFSDYLSNVRIEKAKILLEQTSKAVSEIAFEVGFGDYRYFGQIFKKLTGETPREYHTRTMKKQDT